MQTRLSCRRAAIVTNAQLQEKLMDPYFIYELNQIRIKEIEEEFKRIHLFRSIKINQPNLTNRVLKRFRGLLANRRVEKNPISKTKKYMCNDSRC